MNDWLSWIIPTDVGWITTVVMVVCHVWLWRQTKHWAARATVLALGFLAVTAPWWGAGKVIQATPSMPGILRSLLVGVGTLWGFSSALAIILAVVRRATLRRISGRRRFLRAASGAVVAAPIAIAGYGTFIERTNFRVKEVDFPIPGLHPDLNGLRVVHISDFHAGHFLAVSDVARVIDMANELKPALAVFTGDLITQPGDPLDATIAELARLRADAGVFGCHGNHEIYVRCENYATILAARHGIGFLRRANRTLQWGDGRLNLAGVDYQTQQLRNQYLRRSEKLIVPGAANLLLSHNPDVFPTAVEKGFDAMLAGHTHGGQVTIEILQQGLNVARFKTPFVAGLYRMNERSLYVTNGVGTIGMPVRFGAPPEVVLLRLKSLL